MHEALAPFTQQFQIAMEIWYNVIETEICSRPSQLNGGLTLFVAVYGGPHHTTPHALSRHAAGVDGYKVHRTRANEHGQIVRNIDHELKYKVRQIPASPALQRLPGPHGT